MVISFHFRARSSVRTIVSDYDRCILGESKSLVNVSSPMKIFGLSREDRQNEAYHDRTLTIV